MKYIKNWKNKKLLSKISDIIFIILIVALLIPSSRIEVIGFINRIKAMVIEPSVLSTENTVQISDNEYNWELADIDNNIVNLSAYKNKVLFINIWATWCPPCVGEMPAIQGLYNKFKNNKNVKFILISNENIATIKNFIIKREYTFPVYSAKSQTPKVFNSPSIPTTFLISKEGKIIIHKTGVSNWDGDKMIKIINNLIKE